MSRMFALVASGALTVLLVSACGGGDDDESPTSGPPGSPTEVAGAPCKGGPGLPDQITGERLSIGVLIPGDGADVSTGLDYVNAANLAAKCLNDIGGINGAPVVILTGNSMTDESAADAEADRLATGGGVVAVISVMSNAATASVAESVTIPAGVVLISATEFDAAVLTDPQKLVFGLPATDDSSEEFEAMFTAEYGSGVSSPEVRGVYDAIIVIGLAAEAAGGNSDSLAIRDSLGDVGNPPGVEIGPTAEDIIDALTAIVGGEDVDYQGATNSVNFE